MYDKGVNSTWEKRSTYLNFNWTALLHDLHIYVKDYFAEIFVMQHASAPHFP